VLHELKTDPELSSIPVIMVTILDNEATALSLGASNYLVKPVDRELLASLVEKHRANRCSALPGQHSSHSTADKRKRLLPTAGVRG
jgi:DNA-binding response OmpR family regulator